MTQMTTWQSTLNKENNITSNGKMAFKTIDYGEQNTSLFHPDLANSFH